ncbi:MAG: class I SAM-dependent methyltransferase [Xanthobacteraceae bacterium]|nr:class I SAM-dependent methyltransferase [Xanthobacteraceae bacterium]
MASNPRTYSHVELDSVAGAALLSLTKGADSDWLGALAGAHGKDRTELQLEYGLWSDPSAFGNQQGESVSGQQLLDLLKRRWILVEDDEADYRRYLAPLTSILDRDHLGTFHQVVTRKLAFDERIRDKWKWWQNTKFNEDGKSLRDGPYKWVQEPFFDKRFTLGSLAGIRILDFACGNGFYANKFARAGAKVIGVDTDRGLINLAQKNAESGVEFFFAENPDECLKFLLALPASSFDKVYMGDVVLLLADTSSSPSLAEIMSALARLLRLGGVVHTFEPNAAFWLSPRFGADHSPYAIITEYRQQTYAVAPTMDRIVNLMSGAGLALVEYAHPTGENIPKSSARLRAFAERFPMWDFSTYQKIS